MSQIKKLINQKFLEGIDSTKFHVAQNGAIMAKDSSGAMVEFLKVNSDNKGVVLGKVISTKDELDEVIADLAAEVLARESGDTFTLNSAKSYADQKISDLINGAPQLLDTLKELADAIGNDENFAVTIANQVAAVQAALDAEILRAQGEENALKSRMTTAEGDIDTLEGRMDTAEGDIDAVEARMSSAEGRLSAVEPKVATLEGEMDEAQADIGALETRMTTAESDIDALEVEMGLAKDRLDVLEDDMQSAQQDINELFTSKADTSYVNSQLTIKLQEAKDYADAQDEIVLDDAKSYADTQDAVKLIEAKSYADTKDAEKLLEAKQYAVEQDALKLAEAKAYTDSEMASEEAARIQGDADTLQSSKDYTDAEVLEEKNRAMGVESGLQSSIDAEVQNRIDAIAAEVVARDAAILVEKNRAEGAEAGLQSAIDVEKGRVDAILDASQADKDSFAEIVSLINSVDLENDNALASIILAEQTAREEADAALDARLDIVEPKVSTLETGLAQELIDRAAGDAANLSRIETLEGFAVAQTIYVSKNGNDTTGTGGQHKPFLTLTKAFAMITDASPTKRYVVRVAAGAYTEASVALPSNVFVIGEQKETVRITGAVSMGAWTQDNSGSDDRSGFSMVTLLSAANFNWQTAKSRAGKLYMNEVVFGSTLNLYGYDNAIAQAQFDSCVIFGAVTISGINVGVFSNNVCYNNVTLNQHPNGGMASILAASGGYCSGTVRFNTTVNDFGRRSSGFLRAFPSENLIVDGSSSYADVDLISQGKSSTQKLNSGNLVALNPRISHDIETQMIKPLNTNSHNMGDWGKQWMFNFGYVHASSGSDLYLSSLDSSYDAAGSSAGYGVFIESDGYGLKPNVNGGDINLTTGAVSGTGVRGKIKFDAREIDASSKKITSLADGSASGDAVNKGQLDAEVSRAQVAEGELDGRIDILEAMAFYKESKQVGSGDLSYVELAKEAKPYSIKVFVGRLALHEGQDFSVSVVGGKSRLTWMGDFMVGGAEEIEEGMKLFFEYYC